MLGVLVSLPSAGALEGRMDTLAFVVVVLESDHLDVLYEEEEVDVDCHELGEGVAEDYRGLEVEADVDFHELVVVLIPEL